MRWSWGGKWEGEGATFGTENSANDLTIPNAAEVLLPKAFSAASRRF